MTTPTVWRALFGLEHAPAISLALPDVPLKAQGMVGKMSISGVQPKLSMRLDRTNNTLVPVETGGEYILKPQIPAFPHTPENESCCMDIAAALGVEVPPHGLLPLNDGTPAYVVKRFDRRGAEKIPQEHFLQILGHQDKYDGSVEEIGRKLGEISDAPGLDVQLLFERVVLNFLIGNGDAHCQNYSISSAQEGHPRLSPAYDLVCTKLVIPGEEDSALTIHGKRNKLGREDFEALAEMFKVPSKIRYEKFAGRGHQIESLITGSRLPEEFRERFLNIVLERFRRLEIVWQ